MEFLPAPSRLDPPAAELHVWRLPASPGALRQVLAVYLQEGPEEIQLRRGRHGKPRLAGERRLEFNLSHSAGVALVAVSGEVEVGVDVERVRPRRGEGFYRRWARHEAHVKCLGIGLLRARRALPAEPVAIGAVDVGPGYAAAVAARAPELPPLRGWTFGPPRPGAG